MYIQDINPFHKNNKEIAIKIDMKISEVDKILGNPHNVNSLMLSYFSHGISIARDYKSRDQVGGIIAEKAQSGVIYKGFLNGIKIGMRFEEVQEALGNPQYWGFTLRVFLLLFGIRIIIKL